MNDPTEETRKILTEVTNALTDEQVSEISERTWSTEQLQEEFDVVGFAAPFVVAIRKSDGKKGSLQFRHHPRVYFAWKEKE